MAVSYNPILGDISPGDSSEPEPGPDPSVGLARVCTLFNAGTK